MAMAPAMDTILREASIVNLQARTKDDALKELVDILAVRPEVTDTEDLLQHIMERERVISTGIGIGLAMPHVKIPSVTNFVLAIGRSSRGIEFDSLDGQPVHIVAMLCASERQSGEFLKVLAQLVLKLKNKSLRQQVMLKPDPEVVRKILIEGID
jgi:mannitol/fructose-specific phosphotransferase system IIA component (Ntr-type)